MIFRIVERSWSSIWRRTLARSKGVLAWFWIVILKFEGYRMGIGMGYGDWGLEEEDGDEGSLSWGAV